ncbi:MAG: tripartite tricarboxylate transporter substrate binding protein, partial [Rubrivivax sp.]|nr:tripartite tricarboxylate transporter substrate binding protein [Rubrivivax sp.]
AKRIRPLAAVSDKALELEGFGTIEPITKTLPNLKVATNYFGIFIPKGVPPDVVATITKIWNENIKTSEAVKKYAVSRGALFQPVAGDDAQKAAAPAIAANAWLMHDSGKTKVSPDTVGIPKP